MAGRCTAAALLLIIGTGLAYVAAAAIGSAIPVNSHRTKPESGVRIYVADNGLHTDLVLPVRAEGIDWSELALAGNLADPRHAGHSHVMIGWGDRDFYLNTPTWREFNPLRAARSLLGGGPAVVHVYHVPEPREASDVRAITLRPEEYRRLAAHVRAAFAIGRDGRVPSVAGYGDQDAFYAGNGRYGLYATCNEWTGAALREAGVPMGAWTPLTFGVMRWL